jgi:hypothetical protein
MNNKEIKEIVGQRHGSYVIIKHLGTRPTCKYYDKQAKKERIMTQRFFLAVCDCGTKKELTLGNIRNGKKCKSCGRSKENPITANPLYAIWNNMIHRCTNPKTKNYRNYGGRGITVCDSWLNSFENFYDDMGDRPDGLSIDRKNVNGNYEKDNCRWATDKEQGENRQLTGLLTQANLAKRVNLSRERVRQIYNQAVRENDTEFLAHVEKKIGRSPVFKESAEGYIKNRKPASKKKPHKVGDIMREYYIKGLTVEQTAIILYKTKQAINKYYVAFDKEYGLSKALKKPVRTKTPKTNNEYFNLPII